MFVLGITGGIGSGKSEVLRLLKNRAYTRVVEADIIAHELMRPGNELYYNIIESFGTDILCDNGDIDRSALGRIAMKDDERLKCLNGLSHPAVKRYIINDIEASRDSGVELYVIEAALLIQDNYREICDEIWYIQADADIRLRRLIEYRGMTEDRAISFMENQPPDAYYQEHSDRILNNNYTKDELKSVIAAMLLKIIDD